MANHLKTLIPVGIAVVKFKENLKPRNSPTLFDFASIHPPFYITITQTKFQGFSQQTFSSLYLSPALGIFPKFNKNSSIRDATINNFDREQTRIIKQKGYVP